jgi:hypothetical protein
MLHAHRAYTRLPILAMRSNEPLLLVNATDRSVRESR